MAYINELCNEINTYLVHELNIDDEYVKNEVMNYITQVNDYFNPKKAQKNEKIASFFEEIDKELNYIKGPAASDVMDKNDPADVTVPHQESENPNGSQLVGPDIHK